MERRPSRQKVVVVMVRVTVHSVVIQVILVMTGSEEGRSRDCRRLRGGIGEQSRSWNQVWART
jgi:hypothetical protein